MSLDRPSAPRSLALATVATLATLVTLAFAAPANAALKAGYAESWATTFGANNTIWYVKALSANGKTYYGSSEWRNNGEHLIACDGRTDGLGVRGEVSYPNQDHPGHIVQTVSDPNGNDGNLSGPGKIVLPKCGDLNLSLPEHTPVRFRTCVGNLGCTPWRDARA